MRFYRLFDVFSRRQAKSPKPVTPLTTTFRNRLIFLCHETFGPSRRSPNFTEFWHEIHRHLRYLLGTLELSPDLDLERADDAVRSFVETCPNANVLDFIEYIFVKDAYLTTYRTDQGTYLAEEINQLFLADDLPYALTPFVWDTDKASFDNARRVLTSLHPQNFKWAITAYPQVIRRDDQITHAWSIEPSLMLLREKRFTSANQEFLKALEDYRKGDYGDCLAKCGSAFESTMKLICDQRGWAYSHKDTAKPLLDIVVKNSRLDSFFDQPLLIIATLRNRISSAHGAGTQQRSIPQHLAKYAINATAAAILLLVEECT